MKKIGFCIMVLLTCLLMCGQVYANDTENTLNSDTESNEQNDNDDSNQPVCEYTNYYCEGTEWYYYYYYPYVNEEHTELTIKMYKSKYWLEGEIELDGEMYYCIWGQVINKSSSTPSIVGYVRTKDNKVWKKNVSRPHDPEIMVFDFNLAPGESFTYLSEHNETISTYVSVTCLSQNQYYDEKMGGLPYMEVEWTAQYTGLPFDDDVPVETYKSHWIRGIGGFGGLDEPRYQSQLLYAVYYNGVALFDNEPSGVNALPEEYNVPIKGNKYHLDGRIFKDGDRGISISNGKKVIRN